MRNPNSLEEVAEIHNLLTDIKKEYTDGIRGVLRKNDPELFRNVHTIPKLEKIQINRGLGLSAQNTNILKKSIQEFTAITGQKPLITRSKKAIAGFKIREDMELGLTVTLRGEKMYAFLTNLIFFTFDALVMLINCLVVFHYISFFFFTIWILSRFCSKEKLGLS